MEPQLSLVQSAPLPSGFVPFQKLDEEVKCPFSQIARPRQTIRIQQNDNMASLVMKSPVLSKIFSIQKPDSPNEKTLFDELKTSYNQKKELSISQQGSHRSIGDDSRSSVGRQFRCSKSNATIQKIVSGRPLASREKSRTEQSFSLAPAVKHPKDTQQQSEALLKSLSPGELKESLASVSTDSSQAKLVQNLSFKVRSKSIDNSQSFVASNSNANTTLTSSAAEPCFKVASNLGMTDLLKTVSQNRDFIIKKQHLPGANSLVSPVISAESSPCNSNMIQPTSQHDRVKGPSSFAEMFARKTQTENSPVFGLSGPLNKSRQDQEEWKKEPALSAAHSTQNPVHPSAVAASMHKKLSFRHDIVSVKGVTPGKVKINQDYAGFFKFATKTGHEVRIYSLADGHGPFGDCASRLAVQMLTSQIHMSLADLEDMENISETKTAVIETIKLAFLRVQKALKSDKQSRFRLSGTTMILVLVFQNTVFLANLGDSRVIIGSAKDPAAGWPSPSTCSFETKLHKPEDTAEKERINACGGLVEPYVDEVTGEISGPPRVWNRQRMAPGLAISRTLGDTVAHSVGVSSDPGKIDV